MIYRLLSSHVLTLRSGITASISILVRMILRSFLDYFIGSSSHTSIIMCTFIRLNSSFTDISFSFLKFVPTNPGLSSGLQDPGTMFWKTRLLSILLFHRGWSLLLVPMCSIVCILQAQKYSTYLGVLQILFNLFTKNKIPSLVMSHAAFFFESLSTVQVCPVLKIVVVSFSKYVSTISK